MPLLHMPELFITVMMYNITSMHNYKAPFIYHNYKIALMSRDSIFVSKLIMKLIIFELLSEFKNDFSLAV